MRVKSKATALTDDFVEALGRKWPTTIMNWDTKMNGKFVPWGYVKQAVSALDRGDTQSARSLLMRVMTTGLEGGPDVTGIVGHAPGSLVAAGCHIGWEIKTENDRMRESQRITSKNLVRHGGIYIVVESVEQGIQDTMKYAGPGENK